LIVQGGRAPSPFLPSGDLVSLPIPAKTTHVITYAQINTPLGPLGPVVSALTANKTKPISAQHTAHLDPDLEVGLTARPPGRWIAAFGQRTPGAVAALTKAGVGEGDLFLFFGWFRELCSNSQPFVFKRGANDLHIIFGWLQVGGVWGASNFARLLKAYPAVSNHPHLQPHHLTCPHNMVYTASKKLCLPGINGSLPGAGLFQYDRKRVLTYSGGSRVRRSVWLLRDWRRHSLQVPPLSSHHQNWRWKGFGWDWILQSVGRGQEFVIDTANHLDARNWAASLF
jgi:Nucleotide modification associated domain 3